MVIENFTNRKCRSPKQNSRQTSNNQEEIGPPISRSAYFAFSIHQVHHKRIRVVASESFQSTHGCAEHELYNNSSSCYSSESRASGRTTRGHTPQVDLGSDHKIDLGSVPTVRALSYASSRKNTLPKIRKQTCKIYCCIDV